MCILARSTSERVESSARSYRPTAFSQKEKDALATKWGSQPGWESLESLESPKDLESRP
jgi:hypothetical protein